MTTPTSGSGTPAYGSPETPINLAAAGTGDVLVISDARYTILGKLELTEDGYRWTELRLKPELDPEALPLWLSIDDGVFVVWTERPDVDLAADRIIQFDGNNYRRHEKGHATYVGSGDTGLLDRGRMNYCDYRGPDSRQLSLEQWDTDESAWEASTGTPVDRGSIRAYRPAA